MDQTPIPTPPTWLELVLLMVHGPGRLPDDGSPEPSVHGTIRSVEGSGGPRGVGWIGRSPSDVPALTGQGPSGGRQEVRAWRDGARVRVEEVDGTPSFITDGTATWTFSPGEPPFAAQGRSTVFAGRGTHLLARRTSRDALEGDLARPAGPARATAHLGRAAWEMELSAGGGEEHPLHVMVDAATGLVLEQRIDAVGAVDAWPELTVGDELDDALFTWQGPTGGRDPLEALIERSEDRRRAERAAEARWWARNVDQHQASAVVEVELDLTLSAVHERGRDGSLQASTSGHEARVARRPRSERPWDLRRSGEPPAHRWSTDRWDWAFRLHEDVLTEVGYGAVEGCFGDGEPDAG